MNNNCIFCKLAANEIPSHKIYEDTDFLVFLDLFPSSLGHTLIIPKSHYENIFDIPEDTAANLQRLVVRTAAALKNALGTPHINVLQNNGTSAGQTVFHYHVHLIPRYENDNVNIGWATAKHSPEDFSSCVDDIKSKLSSAVH